MLRLVCQPRTAPSLLSNDSVMKQRGKIDHFLERVEVGRHTGLAAGFVALRAFFTCFFTRLAMAQTPSARSLNELTLYAIHGRLYELGPYLFMPS